jgi:hypothetical protein
MNQSDRSRIAVSLGSTVPPIIRKARRPRKNIPAWALNKQQLLARLMTRAQARKLEIARLYWGEGFSAREVAEEMTELTGTNTTTGAVEQIIHNLKSRESSLEQVIPKLKFRKSVSVRGYSESHVRAACPPGANGASAA